MITKTIKKVIEELLMTLFPQMQQNYKKKMDNYHRALAETGFYSSEAYKILCNLN